MPSTTIAAPSCAIIIPLYNKEKQILRALNSVICQRTPFSQIIVVNDCSTDKSVEIVERFIADHPEAAVQLIQHQRNSGPGAARNTGLAVLQSDYTCFLDADDFLAPTASEDLRRALNACKKLPGLVIYCVREQGSGAVRPSFRHLQQTDFAHTIDGNLLKLMDWASAMVSEPLFCSGGNVLINRQLTKSRFDSALRNFEDWDFYFRVCHAAIDSGLEILVSDHVGLTYTEEDELSLSRAPFVSPSLRNPPPFIANNVDLPLNVRRFTAGVWLCHVTQRSGFRDGIAFFHKAISGTGDARPSLKHFIAASLVLLFGRKCWGIISRWRKRLRYV